ILRIGDRDRRHTACDKFVGAVCLHKVVSYCSLCQFETSLGNFFNWTYMLCNTGLECKNRKVPGRIVKIAIIATPSGASEVDVVIRMYYKLCWAFVYSVLGNNLPCSTVAVTLQLFCFF